MTGKEKLQKALGHQEGPVPMDFGATTVTGIHCRVVESLREIYGLEKSPVNIHEPYQMLGYIDDDLREAMDIDVVGVLPPDTLFGFSVGAWKPWRTPWGQEVLVPGEFNVLEKEGDVYIYPQGDRNAPPSGHMPSGSFFFDTIIRQEPIDEDSLNPEDNLEEFGYISDDDIRYFQEACRKAADTGKGVVANFGGTAFGDIALVPAPQLTHPRGIRDITEWYISTVSRQDYIHQVFEKQSEIAVANLEKIAQAVGDLPDAVFICGTDFGTQTSQFCSQDTFESLYAPYYRKVNDWIHRNTSWKTFKHSCGAVEPFISQFIDAGFDILNPVQCSAAGMDPFLLKERYGDALTFWGGGIDTQQTLPFGTPEEVRKEAASRLEIFSQQGGYVFTTIHNVQANTPVKNLEALLETFQSFRS